MILHSELKLCVFVLNLNAQLLVAASPEDDYQEHLNHRGEHQATRNQIATAQYECFQRIVKESHRKTKTAGEKKMKSESLFPCCCFPVRCNTLARCVCVVCRQQGWSAT